MKTQAKNDLYIKNKKAYFNYHIEEKIEAGIKLLGMEVKSVRIGRVELGESVARIMGDEVYLLNANIPPYQNAQMSGYSPTRSRKLLLHKDQIRSLIGKLSKSGWTLLPLAIYQKRNLIKVELGLGRSKRQFDKRQSIKEKDQQRRIEQELRLKR